MLAQNQKPVHFTSHNIQGSLGYQAETLHLFYIVCPVCKTQAQTNVMYFLSKHPQIISFLLFCTLSFRVQIFKCCMSFIRVNSEHNANLNPVWHPIFLFLLLKSRIHLSIMQSTTYFPICPHLWLQSISLMYHPV